MAPEILRYEKYDAKADLWSVGAVLYEMSVGKPPFRAQNHMELLKKIEQSKGVKFPDEETQRTTSTGGGEENLGVPADIKQLIRALLKRHPVERWSFDEFFGSTALAKSKFPRPPREPSPLRSVEGGGPSQEDATGDLNGMGQPPIPDHHRVIPPEVLDPKAMIPPSKFNFRQRSIGNDAPIHPEASSGNR
jgi:serine/threonine-protein kinase ULK/ATG1